MTTRRRLAWLATALLIVLCSIGLLVGSELRRLARLRSGVTAKLLCSCIFVDRRDEAGCRSDLHPGYDSVQAAIDRAGTTVRAWVPIFAERVAAYRDPSGCTLE